MSPTLLRHCMEMKNKSLVSPGGVGPGKDLVKFSITARSLLRRVSSLGREVGKDEERLYRYVRERSRSSSSAPVLPEADGHGEYGKLTTAKAEISE